MAIELERVIDRRQYVIHETNNHGAHRREYRFPGQTWGGMVSARVDWDYENHNPIAREPGSERGLHCGCVSDLTPDQALTIVEMLRDAAKWVRETPQTKLSEFRAHLGLEP